ncbi:MAG: phosphotransferase [Burkholderiaceae bacterium]|nr:phosphotransferase [Burkholderiaceae bacterium]
MSDEFLGTQPSLAAQRLDIGALDRYLARNVIGYEGPLEVEQFKGGQSNPTFRLAAGDKRYVLRKKPSGALLPSAHAVDREFRVITALRESNVPVAVTHCYCDDDSVIGTPFYVMDFVDGRIFWDPTLPDLNPADRHAVWDDFNRVVAALHSVNVNSVGLSDFGRPGNYFERQIARWTKQYRASEIEPIEAMNRLIDWLPEHIPAGEEVSIVHGDLRLDNLIFHPTEPRVLAVLDWELSTVGHPLADLSYHMLTWRLTAEQFRGMGGADLSTLGIPSEAEYLHRYCDRVGRSTINSSDWEFYLTFSMFRLAAILQGIAKRVDLGTASSPHAAETGRRARPIAEAAWQQVMRL